MSGTQRPSAFAEALETAKIEVDTRVLSQQYMIISHPCLQECPASR
jgi:hypothetical protein